MSGDGTPIPPTPNNPDPDGTYSPPNEDLIMLELPRWMVKQLRGKVRADKRDSLTEYGRRDAEEIEAVLTIYLEEHE